MILVVIEGFGKRETVNKYLGKGYEVFASGGHIRDLPEHSFGIDIKNNFQPLYKNMPDKDKIIKELLQKAKNADGILFELFLFKRLFSLNTTTAASIGKNAIQASRIDKGVDFVMGSKSKIKHIFGQSRHKLEPLVAQCGGQRLDPSLRPSRV